VTDQPGFFDLPAGARSTDPATSHAAAAKPYRRGSLRHRLLIAYGEAEGLTDEEAADEIKVYSGAWKRCSELRNLGMIRPTGATRTSSAGAEQQVCRITFSGRRMLGLIEKPGSK
jgi:hypothetical protein